MLLEAARRRQGVLAPLLQCQGGLPAYHVHPNPHPLWLHTYDGGHATPWRTPSPPRPNPLISHLVISCSSASRRRSPGRPRPPALSPATPSLQRRRASRGRAPIGVHLLWLYLLWLYLLRLYLLAVLTMTRCALWPPGGRRGHPRAATLQHRALPLQARRLLPPRALFGTPAQEAARRRLRLRAA